MYKTQQLYNELSANKEDWELQRPKQEDILSYIEKYDKKYDNVKKLFYREYKSLHKCCPNCGSEGYMTTLLSFALDMDKMDDYKDTNRCTCTDCGDIHIYHDRVPSSKLI
jgi:hypothetical protein